MNVLRKFLEKFRFLSFLKERTFFNKFFIKLKSAISLKSFKSLRGLKLGLFLGILALIISSSGVLYVYSQSGVGGSIGGSSLNKGLIAHWSLDADLYEEATVNLFPINFNSLIFLSAYNGPSYGFGAATNLQQVIDNTLRPKSSSAVTKVSRINSNINHQEYVYIGLSSPLNSTRIISFWYYGTFGSTINPYNNDGSANLFYLNDSGSWIGGGTSLSIPVPTNQWKKIVIKMVNRGVTEGIGFSWLALHSYTSETLSNQEYWAFTEVQLEEKNRVTPYTRNSRIDRVVDSTPYSNHGTNSGATPTTDRHGKVGGAMSFDGVSNRISISYPNPVNQTSVVAWFKRSGSPAGGYHIITGGSNIEISIPDSSGQIRAGVTTNTQGRQVFNSGSGLTDGNWHQVAMTYDGVNLKSFIDGQITATNPVSGNLVGIAGEVGRFLSDAYVANGSIDDVRIYNRALSEEEISLLYGSYEPKTQISSISGGLVGHWTLSEEDYNSSTSQLTDKTPYSNNATNSGATFTTDRHGKTGGAMNLSGGNSISVLNNDSLNSDSLSISFWAYHRDYTYPKTFSPIKKSSPSCYTASGKGWDFGHGYSSDGVDVCVADGSNIIRQTLSFNIGTKPPDLLNEWAHITYIIDRSQNKVLAYINGVKQSSEINIASITGDINNTSNLTIGGLYGWLLDGSINDLRIYNRVLSQAEISLLYSSYNPQTGGDSLQKGLILDMPLTSSYTKTETAGSQIMTDKTPYGNDGQNYGATITADGASFDSSHKLITGNINPPGSGLTLSAWINPTSYPSERFTIIQGTNPAAYYLSLYSDGSINTYWYGTSPEGYHASNSGDAPLNEWTHVVGTWNGAQAKIFINGTEEKSVNVSGIGNTSTKFNIGAESSARQFLGQISNAKIYNRNLSENEIKLLYAQGAASLGGILPQYETSCKEILLAGASNGNGIYRIKPDPSSDDFEVYCDMTTDGGGWTLVLLNNKNLSSPVPQWLDAVSSVNTTGTFGTNLRAFDLFLGIKYWDKLGSKMRLQIGSTPTTLTNKAIYSGFSFSGSNYTLNMTGESILLGSGSTGMFSYHVGGNLSTVDADNDIYAPASCSSVYGGTPWWYKACWSGSFWGYGVLEGARWINANAGEELQHGSIWIGQ